jgi:hypothetical protein
MLGVGIFYDISIPIVYAAGAVLLIMDNPVAFEKNPFILSISCSF